MVIYDVLNLHSNVLMLQKPRGQLFKRRVEVSGFQCILFIDSLEQDRCSHTL